MFVVRNAPRANVDVVTGPSAIVLPLEQKRLQHVEAARR
jgi:hypothetical protein